MLSWQRRAELAETALNRSEAGRTRLRSALSEQRRDAEEQLIEQERQLLSAQRQLRELEAAGGGAMTEAGRQVQKRNGDTPRKTGEELGFIRRVKK